MQISHNRRQENVFSLSLSHLKCHMFQEMCCAIISGVLVATAGIYPEAHLEKNRINVLGLITISNVMYVKHPLGLHVCIELMLSS